LERRSEALKQLSRLDQRSWHLWTVILAVSLSLAIGFVISFGPGFDWNKLLSADHTVETPPQLLWGLLALVILTGAYTVSKQRELMQMRRFLISTLADSSIRQDMYAKDALTGVIDRRALADALELESARTNRFGSPFCLVLCDIRNLDQINLSQGHLGADQALKRVAETLQSTVRKTDLIIRYSATSFLCILPSTDRPGATLFTRRVGRACEEMAKGQTLELDFGISAYERGDNVDKLLAEAEQDLELARSRPLQQLRAHT
jgi:diguanylate cyclase (GGDEF)-like protein